MTLHNNRNSVKQSAQCFRQLLQPLMFEIKLVDRNPKPCGLDLGGIVEKHPSDSSGRKSLSEYLDLMNLTM